MGNCSISKIYVQTRKILMKINKILADKTPTISFEVFPPKAETGLNDVKTAAGAIAALGPSCMSVTYGAAGSTS